MTTRRNMIKAGAGLAAILASGKAPAYIVKSMIAARQIFLGRGDGAKAPTAADYVQDGLVAMWDGIENAGWNTHDETATVWKDLIGSNDMELTRRGSFGDAYLSSNSSTSPYNAAHAQISIDCMAIECVAQRASGNIAISNGVGAYAKNKGVCFSATTYVQFDFYNEYGLENRQELGFGNIHSYSAVYQNTGASYVDRCYQDAKQLVKLEGTNTWANRGGFSVGGGTIAGYTWAGKMYCIRLYDRDLTDAEIVANYAVDKARFNLP